MKFEEVVERQYNQKLYYCNDEKLIQNQLECLELLYDFNETRPSEQEKRSNL